MLKTIFTTLLVLSLCANVEVFAQTSDEKGNIHYPNGTIYVSNPSWGEGPEVWTPLGDGWYESTNCREDEQKCRELLEIADDDAENRRPRGMPDQGKTQGDSLPPQLLREVEEYQAKLKEKHGKWHKYKGKWTYLGKK
jgi:hypothetical protein